MKKRICTFLKQSSIAAILVTFVVSSHSQTLYALTPEQKALFDNNILYYDLASCQAENTVADGNGGGYEFVGSDNAKNTFGFLVDKGGLSKEQAAGVIGNMTVESGVEPQRQQGILDKKTSAEDFTSSGYQGGFGIVQWTPGSKMINPVKQAGKDPNKLEVQLQFLVDQLEGKTSIPEKAAGDQLKQTKTVEDAVLAFQGSADGRFSGYERPANKTESVPRRTAAAKAVLKKYGDTVTEAAATETQDETSTGGCACKTPSDGEGDIADSQTINDQLTELAKKNGGKTSIAVRSIKGSGKGNAGGNEQVPTRSSYKLYTAYATLRAVEEGKIELNDKIWGSKTVDETLEAMIVKSDNNAAEALRTNNTIGKPAKVTAMLHEDLGLSDNTVMGTGSADDAAGSNSKSTANDFVKFLVALEKHTLTGVEKDASYNKLIGYMKRATTDSISARDGIQKGVGTGVEVADKPGWASGDTDPASNDVGIVYAKTGTYAVAILTDKPNKWDGVAKIAEGVNGIMTGDTTLSKEPDNDCAESDTGGAVVGDLSATVKRYAHPSPHPQGFIERMPAYAAAVEKAQKDGRYVGGTVRGVPGIDCGGFVSLLLQDSGYETDYNFGGKANKGAGNTYGGQEPWLKQNWKKIDPKSTADMKPGDVAINHDHTYVYVGEVEGFNSKIASASFTTGAGGRAPMAGQESPADPAFNWYRKK